MDGNQYQKEASRTLIDEPGFKLTNQEVMILWNSTGIAGEAGELSESIKHGIFHRHGLDLNNIKEELGDLMWYVAALCTKLGFNLSDVMKGNISKLKRRYPNGYSIEDSKNRADKK